MKYIFHQVDVFTDSPFGGNPLAVFTESKGLTNEIMQKISKEMNLSETAFVFPSANLLADYSIRIYTPEKELPFAGHPTLGTAHILRETGKVPGGSYIIKLAMAAGIINVASKDLGNFLYMKHPLPEIRLPLKCANEISEALGIPISDINYSYCPIQIISTGLPVLIVPITSLDAIKNITVEPNKLKKLLVALGTEMVYTFTQQTINANASIHSRAFAPGLGIGEDPATGSAAGAIAAYLYKHKLLPEQMQNSIYIEQGFEIGRPSSIHVKIEQKANELKSILVGGESVTVIKGWLNI